MENNQNDKIPIEEYENDETCLYNKIINHSNKIVNINYLL